MEAALLVSFFVFYASGFELKSPINGPHEVFGQDSTYILQDLQRGRIYRWHPQNHILYHFAVERGFAGSKALGAAGPEAAYRYLKLFSATCGFAFLFAMSLLFRELGLVAPPRLVLLALAGVSVAAWFHFAAVETHCLALPAIASYLVGAARLRRRTPRTIRDHLLLIASLCVCSLSRVELFYFAVVSQLWLVLPRLRRARAGLAIDLALVYVLFVVGNAWLAHAYFHVPLGDLATRMFARHDVDEVGRSANLRLANAIAVGRAVSLYSLMAPVDAQSPERGFFAAPVYPLSPAYRQPAYQPATTLFLTPASHAFSNALSLAALTGVASVLLWALSAAARRIAAGDPLQTMIALQIAVGWLLYTWWNPYEPFLWIAEFMPLWLAAIADAAQPRGRTTWSLLAALAATLAAHNWFAFYVSFR